MTKKVHEYDYGINVEYRYPDIRISIEEITPDVANKMLGANLHNRSAKRVSYAKDMADGMWQLNGSTIVFSKDGTLLDGQNRLIECVRANAPFTTIVVRGVNGLAQESMDIGASRTLSDMLSLRGYPNAVSLAAIAPSLAMADKTGSVEGGLVKVHTDTFTRRQLLDYVERNYESMQLNTIVNFVRRVSTKQTPASMWGVLIREMLKSGEDNVEEFVKQVSETKTPSDQVFLLNKKLEKNRESTKSEQKRIIAAWIIKAWNAWMQAAPVTSATFRLRLGGAHPESYPIIYIPEND